MPEKKEKPMKINFTKPVPTERGALVFLIGEDGAMGAMAAHINEQTGGQLSRALDISEFKGKAKSVVEVVAPSGRGNSRILLVGIGNVEKLTATDAEQLGGEIYARLGGTTSRTAAVMIDEIEGLAIPTEELAARMAFGARLRAYKFAKYKSPPKKDKPDSKNLTTLSFGCARHTEAAKLFQPLESVARGVCLARDLVNEPANSLTPAEFAKRCRKLADIGLEVDVLREKEMRMRKMNALLGVGQGSANSSRLVIMRWDGAEDADAPMLAFVGKGVTFDTGGISLKPGAGMGDMKGDMGGAAAVTGLMAALAGRKARVNAVGVIGLVENMPDGKAQRPGDVVTSMSGQTIEILNTDAEGRLVLADALTLTCEDYKPEFVVNLATLTGAILVALGKEYAGLFSNNDDLAARLTSAGEKSGEKVWRLPLHEVYDKMIDSKVADMKNIGGRWAGSITAAQFLQRYVGETPWAHIDVAGTAMDSPATAINQSWGSGYGVRLLDRLIADEYE
ncbi:MAG: leucyl aminopeptidase [Hyphomicrobiales bacterium]|nr:MAG: leucyl aminopeptidase [Hyphomicrobiales bacterium]